MKLYTFILILFMSIHFSCTKKKIATGSHYMINETSTTENNLKDNYKIISQWKGDGNYISKLVLIKRNDKNILITEYVDHTPVPLNYSDETIGSEMGTENNKEFWDLEDPSHGFKILDNGNFKNTNANDNQTIYIKIAH